MTYYVFYRGEWPVYTAACLSEAAKHFGITNKSAHFLCTPSYRKRKARSNKALVGYRVEVDE